MNNGYGYNPYMQQRFQPMEQPMQVMPQQMQQMSQQNVMQSINKQNFLSGKLIESVDVVKVIDIPMDGSINYFPVADGSAIATKQLQTDGTSKTIIYRPVNEEEKELPKYLTMDDIENIMEKFDNSDLESLREDFKDLRRELKDMKIKLKIKEN